MSKLIGSLVVILCIIGVCTAFFLGFTPSQASAEIAELPVRDYLDQFNVIGDIARDYVENIRDTLGELSTFYETYQEWEFDEDDEAFKQTLRDLGLLKDELDSDSNSSGVIAGGSASTEEETGALTDMLIDLVTAISRVWSFGIQFIILVTWGFRVIVSIIMILVQSIGFFIEVISVLLGLLLGVGFGEYLL